MSKITLSQAEKPYSQLLVINPSTVKVQITAEPQGKPLRKPVEFDHQPDHGGLQRHWDQFNIAP